MLDTGKVFEHLEWIEGKTTEALRAVAAVQHHAGEVRRLLTDAVAAELRPAPSARADTLPTETLLGQHDVAIAVLRDIEATGGSRDVAVAHVLALLGRRRNDVARAMLNTEAEPGPSTAIMPQDG